MVAAVGKYLDLIKQAEGCAVSAVSAVSPAPDPFRAFRAFRAGPSLSVQVDPAAALRAPFGRLNRFGRTFAALEARCPDWVPADRWQQCVGDGRAFLVRWGHQAFDLGWTSADLFGLLPVPAKPHPSFSRLSRYDAIGLVWLLDGREVTGLTTDAAAIRAAGGAITIYRKHDKPALGPVGDDLGDLQ
jgi:hypothetical protein